jgi:hypothetical protein
MLFYSIALLVVGVQLLSLGVLAELVTAYNIRAEDTYSIAETIEAGPERIPDPEHFDPATAALTPFPPRDEPGPTR